MFRELKHLQAHCGPSLTADVQFVGQRQDGGGDDDEDYDDDNDNDDDYDDDDDKQWSLEQPVPIHTRNPGERGFLAGWLLGARQTDYRGEGSSQYGKIALMWSGEGLKRFFWYFTSWFADVVFREAAKYLGLSGMGEICPNRVPMMPYVVG